MATPAPFENLLTSASASRYLVNRFSVRRAWAEVNSSADRLSLMLGEDMKHFHELRSAVREALATQPDQQPAAASLWKTFLKPRIEMLDYWSNAVGAFAAFCAGVLAVGSVLARSFGPASYLYLAAAGIAAAVLAIKKFELDRHKCWYKYLVSHLEAIEKAAQK